MLTFIIDIVKIILIIGLSLVSVLIILKYYFLKKPPVSFPERIPDDNKIILPLRLQAYERIILFLERIQTSNLVMRVNRTEMTVLQLQTVLLQTIRDEFEYNLSQQLYISARSWELVKNAKEEVIRMINIAATDTQPDAPSAELARLILEVSFSTDKSPVDSVLEEVKKEIQQEFRPRDLAS